MQTQTKRPQLGTKAAPVQTKDTKRQASGDARGFARQTRAIRGVKTGG